MNTLIAASQNIQGNIGICQINETSGVISVFYKQVYFINSCTGEIVNSNLFFDWPMAVLLGVLSVTSLLCFLVVMVVTLKQP